MQGSGMATNFAASPDQGMVAGGTGGTLGGGAPAADFLGSPDQGLVAGATGGGKDAGGYAKQQSPLQSMLQKMGQGGKGQGGSGGEDEMDALDALLNALVHGLAGGSLITFDGRKKKT